VRLGLVEDQLDVGVLFLFKLFLQEATSVLILAKAVDLADKVFKLYLSEADVLCEWSEW